MNLIEAIMSGDAKAFEDRLLSYFKEGEDETVFGVIGGVVLRGARRRGPDGEWQFRFWTNLIAPGGEA